MDKSFPSSEFLHNLLCSRSIFEADDSSVDRADYSANFTQTSSKDGAMTIDNVGERDHDQDYADDVENVGHFPSAKVSIIFMHSEQPG